MYQEYNYLIHSKGPWKKKTKYKKKVKVNGVWKYIYTDNYLEADRFEDEKGTYKETENGVRIRVDDEKPLGHFKYSDDQDIAYDVRRLSRDISDNVKDKAKSFERLQEAKDDVARAYKDQQDAAERRGKIIAEAYADQKKKEKKSMTHGADTEGYSYLIHSAKGSSWSKKDHKYIKKYKSTKSGRWVYVYRINKDKSIKLESDTPDAETEALLDNYAARLKTMDINSDGTYLKNGERRIFEGKSYFDNGSRMTWTSKTNRMDSSYKDIVNDKEKLKKEITGNPSTGFWQNVNTPSKFELNDEMRRDNQKALAKGIKKLKNKK